jgi:vitamin B12 transporter
MSLKTRFSVLAILCSASFISAAQDIDDIMIVTADRFESTPDQLLAVVNTIERAEIDKIAPKSVVDLLEVLPGVSITRNGGAGQNAEVSIRGANSDHVLVLIDGVRISSATLGSVSFSSLAPEQIERIEVVKGPRAAVWGSDAIGGVIQIFTRKLAGGEGFAGIEIGSDNYSRYSAGAGINHGDGRSSLTVSKEQSDGFDTLHDGETDDDGYDRLSFGITGEQTLSDQWLLNWNGQLTDGSYEYDSSYGGNKADYDNYFWRLGAEYKTQLWQSQFSVGQSQDSNENYRDGVEGKSLFETQRDQLSWINQFQLTDILTINAGVDYVSEDVKGEYAVDERDSTGLFTLVRADLDAWLFEAIVRYDDVENIDSETSYNVSAALKINENWRLSTSYGTGFKAPTFNDLYWPNLGNPTLTSETSTNTDITLSYNNDHYHAYISAFRTDVDDLISWVNTGIKDNNGWDIYQPDNIEKAEITGAEIGVDFSTYGLVHQLGYTYLDAENSITNQDLVGRSEHEFNYSATYGIEDWDLRLDYHYQGKRRDSFDYLDAYQTVDLSIGYAFSPQWLVRLKTNNIFNEDTVSRANYNAAGAQWFVSLSYNCF